MDANDNEERRRRGSCMAIMLTGTFVGFGLVLLIVATGGWVVYVVGTAAAIAVFGLVHYLLWGRLLLQQTAGEREEEEVRRRAEERQGEEAHPGANGYRRVP